MSKSSITLSVPDVISNIVAWSYLVKARDKFICQKCYQRCPARELHAHHIISRMNHENNLHLRISNGLALCGKCHRQLRSEQSAKVLNPKVPKVYPQYNPSLHITLEECVKMLKKSEHTIIEHCRLNEFFKPIRMNPGTKPYKTFRCFDRQSFEAFVAFYNDARISSLSNTERIRLIRRLMKLSTPAKREAYLQSYIKDYCLSG